MTALSELLPAGGGAGKVMDFVASGTLPNGVPVLLKADGTVEVVLQTGTPITESIPAGSEVVFNAASTNPTATAFDPNTANKFIIAYPDGNNGGYGTAIVGTVSGTTISFGSEYVFRSGNLGSISVSFDPNSAGKFVVGYTDAGTSHLGTAIVGTVSGTTISFGSAYVFNSAITSFTSVAFDPNTANKFVVAYRDSGNANFGTAIVGTVSGTTISFGSEYIFRSAAAGASKVAFDPNTANKFVVGYTDDSVSYRGKGVVGTITGTSLSFGTPATFNTGTTYDLTLAFDPNTANKFVVAFQDSGNSSYGTTRAGTVSGTTISFGSEYVFNSASTGIVYVAFDPNTANKFVVAFRDGGNLNRGKVMVGTLSGTTITFGSEYTFNSGATYGISPAFDYNTTGKFVVTYKDNGNSEYGTAIVGQMASTEYTTNLTTTNFVGITSKAIADTATGSITLQGGVSTNQSSLTSGSTYYVQGDGTVSTVSTAPAVNIGKALNATTLKLKGLSV